MKSRKRAKVIGEFLGIQRCTHEDDLEVRPPLKQVTNDDHEEVRKCISFMNLIKNNMGGLGKQATMNQS